MNTTTALSSFALAAALLVNLPAHAEPPAAFQPPLPTPKAASAAPLDEPDFTKFLDAEARELVKMGFAAERKGEPQETVLEYFYRAQEIAPSAATDGEVGLAELRAGHPVPALRWLERAVSGYQFKILPRSEEHYKRKIEVARGQVATLSVVVNQPGSVVNVDGTVVRDWPFHDHIYVLPGKHEVKATKVGYWMSHTQLDVKAGQVEEIRLALQPRDPETVRTIHIPAQISMGNQEQPTWPMPVIIASGIVLGVSSGMLIGGLVAFTSAQSTAEAAAARVVARSPAGCSDPLNASDCKLMNEANDSTGKNIAIVGGIGAGLGLTGLIIGFAGRPTPPSLIIQPAVGLNGAGASVMGTF